MIADDEKSVGNKGAKLHHSKQDDHDEESNRKID